MCYRLPNSMHTICSDRRCGIAIKLSYLLPFIVCSPTFLVFEILKTKVVENGTISTLYHLGLSRLARVNHELLYMMHLWTYAVIIKLLPCLILTVVTISLVSSNCYNLLFSMTCFLYDVLFHKISLSLKVHFCPLGSTIILWAILSGHPGFWYDTRVKYYMKNYIRYKK
jgi:hypothetical protein